PGCGACGSQGPRQCHRLGIGRRLPARLGPVRRRRRAPRSADPRPHRLRARPPDAGRGDRSRRRPRLRLKGEHMSENAAVATYIDAETQVLSAGGIEYAYRATGAADSTPLVLLQHFRGNLDNWDPALIDALARGRRVITFDNRGVAASSGTTPNTIVRMALDAIDFIDALDVGEVDLLGFSIGSFVAQEIALVRPSTVRMLVLASSAPQGASGMHGWP